MALFVVFSLIPCLLLDVHAEVPPLSKDELGVTTSRNMFCMDRNTNQVLLDDNSDQQIYVASLTKMMTELLAIEHFSNYDQTVTITNEMLDGLIAQNASVAGFAVGDEPTVLDLLYGAALPSGADAVNALAISVSGSIDGFVALMNEKAKELQMNNTHFTNPTGLHNDDHYSTCRDMAKLMNACLEYPIFKEIIQKENYTTSPITSHTEGLTFESTVWKHAGLGNEYATTGEYKIDIPGLIGGKTGYTIPAGRCLATNLQINGMDLICIVCGSNETGHFLDTANIATHIENQYQRVTIAHSGDVLKHIEIEKTFPPKTLAITLDHDVNLDLEKSKSYTIQTNLEDTMTAPLQMDQDLGSWYLETDNEVVYEEKITCPETIQ